MIKFSAPQLLDMLALQNRVNTVHAGPLWRAKKYAWHRAAWSNCSRIIDHIGWQWWEPQTPDLPKAQWEVIKVWILSLSYALEATHEQVGTDDLYIVADSIRNDMTLAENSLTFGFKTQVNLHGEVQALLNLVELLVSQCVSDQQVSPAITLELAEVLGLDAESMYKLTIAKNLCYVLQEEYGVKHEPYYSNIVGLILRANPGWDSIKVHAEACAQLGPLPKAANDHA